MHQVSGASNSAAVPGAQLYQCSAEAQERAQAQVPGQQATSAAVQTAGGPTAPFAVVVLGLVVLLGAMI